MKGLFEIKNIKGYKITKDGQVWSDYKKGFLKPEKITKTNLKGQKRTYLRVSIHGKKILIHRLMAMAFDIPSVDGYYEEINHKDCDGTNNSLDNLERCSRKYNNQYDNRPEKISRTSKETVPGVPVRCFETGIVYRTIHEAARMLGLTSSGIWNALQPRKDGGRRNCKGYTFEYA